MWSGASQGGCTWLGGSEQEELLKEKRRGRRRALPACPPVGQAPRGTWMGGRPSWPPRGLGARLGARLGSPLHPRNFTPDSRPKLLWTRNRNSPEHPENPLCSASPGIALNIKGVLQQEPTNTAPSRSSEHASVRCCLMQGGCRSGAEFLLKHTHTHPPKNKQVSKLTSLGGAGCGWEALRDDGAPSSHGSGGSYILLSWGGFQPPRGGSRGPHGALVDAGCILRQDQHWVTFKATRRAGSLLGRHEICVINSR